MSNSFEDEEVVNPHVKPGVCSTNNKSAMDETLELSCKDFWVIVHFKESDPGKEFEILHNSKLMENSWETLKKGVKVTVSCGKCRSQGTVICISDDKEYLEKNFLAIKQQYLEEQKVEPEVDTQKKMAVFKRKRNNSVGQPHVIKIAEKGTQTKGNEDDYLEMEANYFTLKMKYEDLKLSFETFVADVQEGLDKAEYRYNKRIRTRLDSMSPISNKENLRNARNKARNISDVPKNMLRAIQNVKMAREEDGFGAVTLGSGGTKVPHSVFQTINWDSYTSATRKLLMAVFDRTTLATHSLTGKPSPAFIGTGKQSKSKLDPIKISDIVETVSQRCGISHSLVRSVITTKCADENKMFRKREEKCKENTAVKPKKKH